MLGISIVICCYNSSSRLPNTLNHLIKQITHNKFSIEIIIVDNNSTDNTLLIAKKFEENFNFLFKINIVSEANQGILYARKRGVKEANFEYIIFCDDDNWLDKYYTLNVFNILSSDASIGMVGGRSIGVSSIDFPQWFNEFELAYAVGEPHSISKDISNYGQIWTAGMGSRKSLLLKVFDENFPFYCIGRSGENLTSGEDDEMCMRVLLLNFRLIYSKDLIFYHFIEPHRLTMEYKNALFKEFRHSTFIHQRYMVYYKISNKKNHISRVIYLLLLVLYKKITFKDEIFIRINIDEIFYITKLKIFSNLFCRQIVSFKNKYSHIL
jgi:glycosyltransferase involved in cell wall biosynthesis